MCNFSPSSQHDLKISPETLAALADLMRAAAERHGLDLPPDLEIILTRNTEPARKHSEEDFFYAQHMF